MLTVTIANGDSVWRRNPVIKFKKVIKALLLCWPDSSEANISGAAVKQWLANREVIEREFCKSFES